MRTRETNNSLGPSAPRPTKTLRDANDYDGWREIDTKIRTHLQIHITVLSGSSNNQRYTKKRRNMPCMGEVNASRMCVSEVLYSIRCIRVNPIHSSETETKPHTPVEYNYYHARVLA